MLKEVILLSLAILIVTSFASITWSGNNFSIHVNGNCHTVDDSFLITLTDLNISYNYQDTSVDPSIFCWGSCFNYPSNNVFDGMWVCQNRYWVSNSLYIQSSINITNDGLLVNKNLTINSDIYISNSVIKFENPSSVLNVSCISSRNLTLNLNLNQGQSVNPINYKTTNCGTLEINNTKVINSNSCVEYDSSVSSKSGSVIVEVFKVNDFCNKSNLLWLWILLGCIGVLAIVFAIIAVTVKKIRNKLFPFADRLKFKRSNSEFPTKNNSNIHRKAIYEDPLSNLSYRVSTSEPDVFEKMDQNNNIPNNFDNDTVEIIVSSTPSPTGSPRRQSIDQYERLIDVNPPTETDSLIQFNKYQIPLISSNSYRSRKNSISNQYDFSSIEKISDKLVLTDDLSRTTPLLTSVFQNESEKVKNLIEIDSPRPSVNFMFNNINQESHISEILEDISPQIIYDSNDKKYEMSEIYDLLEDEPLKFKSISINNKDIKKYDPNFKTVKEEIPIVQLVPMILPISLENYVSFQPQQITLETENLLKDAISSRDIVQDLLICTEKTQIDNINFSQINNVDENILNLKIQNDSSIIVDKLYINDISNDKSQNLL